MAIISDDVERSDARDNVGDERDLEICGANHQPVDVLLAEQTLCVEHVRLCAPERIDGLAEKEVDGHEQRVVGVLGLRDGCGSRDEFLTGSLDRCNRLVDGRPQVRPLGVVVCVGDDDERVDRAGEHRGVLLEQVCEVVGDNREDLLRIEAQFEEPCASERTDPFDLERGQHLDRRRLLLHGPDHVPRRHGPFGVALDLADRKNRKSQHRDRREQRHPDDEWESA